MQKEVAFAVAREVARVILKNATENVEFLTMSDTLDSELPGIRQAEFDKILKVIVGMLEASEMEFYFLEWKLNDDGSIKSDDDAESGRA
jgi:hypothetical protein